MRRHSEKVLKHQSRKARERGFEDLRRRRERGEKKPERREVRELEVMEEE